MKKLLLLLTLIFISFTSNAQLRYTTDGKLTFGNISLTNTPYATAWEGYGHYFHYNNSYGDETWLKITLAAANARISGNGGYVVFYGDTFEDIYVKNVYTNSDARAKTNILPLSNAITITRQLRPKTYGWVSSSAHNSSKTTQREFGFLAQDLETIIPEAVVTDPEGNKLVNYNTIIPILAGAIQELEERVVQLETRIRELESIK